MKPGFRKVFTRFAFRCPVCGFSTPGRCVAEQHEESLIACCTGCSNSVDDVAKFIAQCRSQFNVPLPNAYWDDVKHQWFAISGTGDASHCESESTVPDYYPACT